MSLATAPHPVSRRRPAPGALLKVLGVSFGLAVLVGNTIGMGILRTPGEVAARVPSVPLFMGVWVAGAVYALLGALSVAELAAMRPRSGGLYPLVHDALGPYPGFVVGWSDWLSTCGSTAAVALVLGEYAVPLLPTAPRPVFAAGLAIILFGVLQWRGVRLGDAVQRGTSLLKAAALVVLAVVALATPVTTAPAQLLEPSATLPAGVALLASVVIALQSAIYTYDGWTGPVYFAEEVQDPGRAIPRAMVGGVLLVMGIYLALNAAFLHVVPVRAMAGDQFVAATAARRLFGPGGELTLRVVMIVSLVAAVNALLLMASRVPFAISRDRLLPAWLARVNGGGTPVAALGTSVGIALLCLGTNTFDTLLAMLAFMFVANYALTFTALFVARRRQPGADRPFRVPGYPAVPAIALIGSVAFMLAAVLSDPRSSLIAVALVAASWPVYRLARRPAAS
jgi:APA family basic amino acid/polyamine antiporter